MAYITAPENPGFPEVYLIEENDDVLGGEGGTANRQAKEIVEQTAFLKKAIEKLIADLGGDLNSATAVISSLAQKANLASPVFTGTPTVPSKSTAASSSYPTRIATEAQVALKANTASPTFTGTPKVPAKTSAATSDGTLIATEAQVAFKANITSPNFSGTPTINSNPIAAVSLSSDPYDPNCPVGSYILIAGASVPISEPNRPGFLVRNRSIVPYLGGSIPEYYTLIDGTADTALTGTWKSCGIGNGVTLARRVA